MRKSMVVLSLFALALLAFAGAAYALTTAHGVASFNPIKAGTPSSPKRGTFKVSTKITTDNPNGVPPSTKTIRFSFDKNIHLMGADLASSSRTGSCKAVTIATSQNPNDPRCKDAKLGTGSATAKLQSGGAPLTFDIAIFNGPKGKSWVVFAKVRNLSVNDAYNSPIVNGSGPYGKTVVSTISQKLITGGGVIPPASLVTIDNLRLSKTFKIKKRINGRIKTVTEGYFQSTGCSGGSYKFRVTFQFASSSGAPDANAPMSSACRK